MKRSIATILMVGVGLLTAIGIVFHNQYRQAEAAERSLAAAAKAASTLHQAHFIAHPKSNLARAYLNHASYVYQQAKKHEKSYSKSQQAKLRQAAARLKDAKLYVAIQTEATTVLGPQRVITDPHYDNTTLDRAFRTLEAADQTYAKAVKPHITLVALQVAALTKLAAAQQSQPTLRTIQAAETAIQQVPVEAFKATYAPIADGLQQRTTANPDAAAPSAARAADASDQRPNPTGQSAGTQAAAPSENYTAPARSPQPAPAKKPAAPAQSPASGLPLSQADRDLIGIGGLFDTMHEAEAAMKAAQNATGNTRQASAYSIQFGNGSVQYTWSWVTNEQAAPTTNAQPSH
ncbi:hypothetical protein ACFQ3L_02905 [Lacticaseibacillus jixianensis]|uniref:Uncharacterized protein n=1 Tax=Lacticaseibacillus jixianensis TaxID=2486012 RepID=A0ABW4B724_9LACO|nr:hypothetical protein [Lacticaseibacillus jixianensis]